MRKNLVKYFYIISYSIIAICCVLIFCMATGLLDISHCTGHSNYPTMSKDNVLIEIKKEPKRLDFVNVEKKVLGGTGIVKRVIGMPGDTVEIIAGIVYINGEALDEPYVRYSSEEKKENYNYEKITLGSDEYFVLGDNRNKSTDSEDFGPVKREKIKYTVLFWVDLEKK